MKRRDALLALAGAGSALAITSQVAWCRDLAGAPVTNVLDHIPADLHTAIRRGRSKTDLARFFDLAARNAVASQQALYVPQGTYSMHTWSPPAHLLLTTDGRLTVFEQLPTGNVPQRFIRVLANNVRLWPGSSATLTGNIAANATSFNSGIQVYAEDGVSIDSFEVGDIYGIDLGGDVFETGTHPGGQLNRCTIGNVFGDNVYRNIVTISAGRTGRIEGVYQIGGVGLMGLDFEPDAGSGSPVETWSFGTVRCRRASIVGDPAVPIGSVSGDLLELDYSAYPASNPPFDYDGVNAARYPTLFEVGFRYRNCDTLRIKRAVISNFSRGAIIDTGEGQADRFTRLVRFDSLELNNNGARSDYEIAQQKTNRLSIGHLRSVNKPHESVATLIGGSTPLSVAEIERAEIAGLRVAAHTGRVSFGS